MYYNSSILADQVLIACGGKTEDGTPIVREALYQELCLMDNGPVKDALNRLCALLTKKQELIEENKHLYELALDTENPVLASKVWTAADAVRQSKDVVTMEEVKGNLTKFRQNLNIRSLSDCQDYEWNALEDAIAEVFPEKDLTDNAELEREE